MTPTTVHTRSSVSVPARRFTYPTQAKFLSQAVLLEEVGPPKIPALACFLGFALVVVAIVASALVKIDVISSSTGKITPSTANHQIQSFDGGIVDSIHVKEGQIVDTGELMLTLADPEAEAQLNQLQARYASLLGQATRIRLLAGISAPQISDIGLENSALQIEQMAILPLEEAAIASERSLLRAEIHRRNEQLKNFYEMEESILSNLELVQEKVNAQKTLYQKNIAQRSAIIEVERELNDTAFRLRENEGKISETEAAIMESKRRLEDAIASKRQRYGDQLSTLMVDLAQLDQQIISLRSRMDRRIFEAPVRGIVHELGAEFSGQIVAPGDKVVELIPIDSKLIVDGRLPPNEIGHVSLGQEVRVAVDGIEPHKSGYLEGIVKHLSPSTFVDENGLPYFQVQVSLTSNEIAGIQLVPGMTVQAQIKTGERTILEYLLKPVYRAWTTAFKER